MTRGHKYMTLNPLWLLSFDWQLMPVAALIMLVVVIALAHDLKD